MKNKHVCDWHYIKGKVNNGKHIINKKCECGREEIEIVEIEKKNVQLKLL